MYDVTYISVAQRFGPHCDVRLSNVTNAKIELILLSMEFTSILSSAADDYFKKKKEMEDSANLSVSVKTEAESLLV